MSDSKECKVADEFLENPTDESFCALFQLFTPQLVGYFRRRGHELALAEDLAQEVMLTVHRKAEQVRDRSLFRAWIFKIARHTLYKHFAKLMREVPTVDLDQVSDRPAVASHKGEGGPAFEFRGWLSVLEPRERDVMTLRFVEEWEYHEIAAAQAIPIGTVQWRVFNSKKKLAAHLNPLPVAARKAA